MFHGKGLWIGIKTCRTEPMMSTIDHKKNDNTFLMILLAEWPMYLL